MRQRSPLRYERKRQAIDAHADISTTAMVTKTGQLRDTAYTADQKPGDSSGSESGATSKIADQASHYRKWRKPQMKMLELIEKISKDASAGCGSVFELYQERFCKAIDRHAASMRPAERDEFLSAAKDYDYESPDVMEENRVAARADGLCIHYLDWNTCPCGCFED